MKFAFVYALVHVNINLHHSFNYNNVIMIGMQENIIVRHLCDIGYQKQHIAATKIILTIASGSHLYLSQIVPFD